LIRVSDGAVLDTLEGHVGWIRSIDFTPDGDLLVSSGTDGTVRLWYMGIRRQTTYPLKP
jgi:WD40 repeat protein